MYAIELFTSEEVDPATNLPVYFVEAVVRAHGFRLTPSMKTPQAALAVLGKTLLSLTEGNLELKNLAEIDARVKKLETYEQRQVAAAVPPTKR